MPIVSSPRPILIIHATYRGLKTQHSVILGIKLSTWRTRKMQVLMKKFINQAIEA